MLIFPLINDTSRKIIHIDMDAFFASVEELVTDKLCDYFECKATVTT